jgi:hypothetical protein
MDFTRESESNPSSNFSMEAASGIAPSNSADSASFHGAPQTGANDAQVHGADEKTSGSQGLSSMEKCVIILLAFK